MAEKFTLVDNGSLQDLRSFLVRSAKIELGAVHLLAVSHVLAATVAVLYPTSLFERKVPTVLALRTFALAEDALFDTMAKQRAILDRIARIDPGEDFAAEDTVSPIELPDEDVQISWQAHTPPRENWSHVATIDTDDLLQAAKAGEGEILEVIPDTLGEARVRKVRTTVWSRTIRNNGPTVPPLLAGSAFGGYRLGFFDKFPTVELYRSGNWLRLSTPFGHILQHDIWWEPEEDSASSK